MEDSHVAAASLLEAVEVSRWKTGGDEKLERFSKLPINKNHIKRVMDSPPIASAPEEGRPCPNSIGLAHGFSHTERQIPQSKRLGQEVDALFQDAMLHDDISGVARHKKHSDVG